MKLDSTMIAEVRYDKDSKDLFVTFRTGKIAVYRDVPFYLYRNLVTADSAGHYFATNIKGKFAFEYVSAVPE